MKHKIKLGANLSVSGGYAKMIETAHSIGADTVQCFIRNPRGGDMRPINEADEKAAYELIKKYGIETSSLIAHAPYTMNPCSAKESVREFTERAMREDFLYLERIPDVVFNFHPGSHTSQGADLGIEHTANCLANAMFAGMKTTVAIETMSGKGSEIGRSFDEIAAIIDRTEKKNPAVSGYLRVCLDTCHLFDAGYDIVNDLDGVLDEFDKKIGLDRICAVHVNDSKNPFASHKDRHEKIGEGTIGLDAMVNIISHKKLRHLPFCLETPNEVNGYAYEIALLRSKTEVNEK